MRFSLKVCLCAVACSGIALLIFMGVNPAPCQLFDEFVDTTRDTPELSKEEQETEDMLVLPPSTPKPVPKPSPKRGEAPG